MKRYIKSTRYDYSNIIGLGYVAKRARRYLPTLPDWIRNNLIQFDARTGANGIIYVLVVEPLESDPDPRPIIFKAYKISEVRKQVAEYEETYVAENRYTDTGYRALI